MGSGVSTSENSTAQGETPEPASPTAAPSPPRRVLSMVGSASKHLPLMYFRPLSDAERRERDDAKQHIKEVISDFVAACAARSVAAEAVAQWFPLNVVYQTQLTLLAETGHRSLAAHEKLRSLRVLLRTSVEDFVTERAANVVRLHSQIDAGSSYVIDGIYIFAWKNGEIGRLLSSMERRASQTLLDLCISDLNVPAMATVSIANKVFTAMIMVPIVDACHGAASTSVLKPRSASVLCRRDSTGSPIELAAMQQETFASGDAHAIIFEVGLVLNMPLGENYSDHVHRGLDGRLYFIGNYRWLPQLRKLQSAEQSPPDSLNPSFPCNPCALPALLIGSTAPLDEELYTEAIEGELLTTVLQECLSELQAEAFALTSESSYASYVTYLRDRGLNSRLLGLVLSRITDPHLLSSPAVCAITVRIVSKAIRDILFDHWEAVDASPVSSSPGSGVKRALEMQDSSNTDSLSSSSYQSESFGGPNQFTAVAQDILNRVVLFTASKKEEAREWYDKYLMPKIRRRYFCSPSIVFDQLAKSDVRNAVFGEVCRSAGLCATLGQITAITATCQGLPVPGKLSRDDYLLCLRSRVESRHDTLLSIAPLWLQLFTAMDLNLALLIGGIALPSVLSSLSGLPHLRARFFRHIGRYGLKQAKTIPSQLTAESLSECRRLLDLGVSSCTSSGTIPAVDSLSIAEDWILLASWKTQSSAINFLELAHMILSRSLSTVVHPYCRRACCVICLKLVELCAKTHDTYEQALRHADCILSRLSDPAAKEIEDCRILADLGTILCNRVLMIQNTPSDSSQRRNTRVLIQSFSASSDRALCLAIEKYGLTFGSKCIPRASAIVTLSALHHCTEVPGAGAMASEALQIMKNVTGVPIKLYAEALLNLGTIESTRNNSIDAQEHFLEAIRILEKTLPQTRALLSRARKLLKDLQARQRVAAARRMQKFALRCIATERAQKICRQRALTNSFEKAERRYRHEIGKTEMLMRNSAIKEANSTATPLMMRLTFYVENEQRESTARQKIENLERKIWSNLMGLFEKTATRVVRSPISPELTIAASTEKSKKSRYYLIRVNSEGATVKETAKRHGTSVEGIVELNTELAGCSGDHCLPYRSVIKIPKNATPNVGATGTTLRELAAKHGMIVKFLRLQNPQLALVGDDDPLPLSTEILIPSLSAVTTPEALEANYDASVAKNAALGAINEEPPRSLSEESTDEILNEYQAEARHLAVEAEASYLVLRAMEALEGLSVNVVTHNAQLQCGEERDRSSIAAEELQMAESISRYELQSRLDLTSPNREQRHTNDVRSPSAPIYAISRAYVRKKWKEVRMEEPLDSTTARLAAMLRRFDVGRQMQHSISQ